MARKAKIVIAAEDQTRQGIQGTLKNILGVEDAVKKMAKGIAGAFTLLGLAELGKQFVKFSADAVKEFGEIERSALQMRAAVNGNDASFKKLNTLIEDLGRQTLSSRKEISDMVADLAALGATDSEIDSVSRAAVNLSNVTGQGLNESMKKLAETFQGNSGELAKLVPEIGQLTSEQLKAGDAAKIVNDRFGDISETMAGGVSQDIKDMSTAFAEMKTNMGEQVTKFINPMIEGIEKIISRWNEAYRARKDYNEALGTGNTSLAEAIRAESDLRNQRDNAFANWQMLKNSSSNQEQDARAISRAATEYENLMRAWGSAQRALQELKTPGGTVGVQPTGGRAAGGLGGSGETSEPDWRKALADILKAATSSGMTGVLFNERYRERTELELKAANVAGKDWTQAVKSEIDEIGSIIVNLMTGNNAGNFQFQTQSDTLIGLIRYQKELSDRLLNTGLSFAPPSQNVPLPSGDNTESNPRRSLLPFFEGERFNYTPPKEDTGNMLQEFFSQFQGLTGTFQRMKEIGDPLITMFNGLFDTIGPTLEQVLIPISDLLWGIGAQLGEYMLPLFEDLAVGVADLAKGLGEVLKPIIQAIAHVMIALLSPIKWLGDLFGWLGRSLQTFMYNLNPANIFNQRSYETFSSDAFTGIPDRQDAIWADDPGLPTRPRGGPGGGPGGGPTYTGSQPITFKFYNQGNVVGSGGMEELATIINNLIQRNARYA